MLLKCPPSAQKSLGMRFSNALSNELCVKVFGLWIRLEARHKMPGLGQGENHLPDTPQLGLETVQSRELGRIQSGRIAMFCPCHGVYFEQRFSRRC